MTVSPEVKEVLEWICTEIGAGKCFAGTTEASMEVENTHNNACERAISIVRNYQEGCGLFQMTRKKS